MPTQEDSGFCKFCDKQTMIRRKSTNHLLHVIITIILGVVTLPLLGVGAVFWIIIWILSSIRIGGWRCTQCGKEASRFSTSPIKATTPIVHTKKRAALYALSSIAATVGVLYILVAVVDDMSSNEYTVRTVEEKQEREMVLLKEVKKIPASEVKKNQQMYMELMSLNPSKTLYQDKYRHYTTKLKSN